MSYPAAQPYTFPIEPDYPEADEIEAVMEEIASDDETFFLVLKNADWTAKIEDVIRAAAKQRIENRKQLFDEEQAERRAESLREYY